MYIYIYIYTCIDKSVVYNMCFGAGGGGVLAQIIFLWGNDSCHIWVPKIITYLSFVIITYLSFVIITYLSSQKMCHSIVCYSIVCHSIFLFVIFSGMSTTEAEFTYIKYAQQLECYGHEFYSAKVFD